MTERTIRLYGWAICMILVIEQTRALSCARGSYSLGGEGATCIRCPSKGTIRKIPFTTRREGATSEDECIPNCGGGTYFIAFFSRYDGVCDHCQAGTYSNGGALYTCTLCEEGTFTSRYRSSSCNRCSAGSVSGRGARNCRPCGWGGYQDEEGKAICKPCGVGEITTTPGTGRTECDPCLNGTTTLGVGFQECLQVCAPGTSGRYGLEPCSLCYLGSYAATRRSSQCTLCSGGTSTQNYGATSFTQCNVCAAGYIGRRTCVMCPIGRYSGNNSSFCKRCPSGTTTMSSATPSLSGCVCRPGSFGNFGFPPCTTCAKGTYQGSLGRDDCNLCPDGETTSNTGATDQASCSALPAISPNLGYLL